MENWLRAGRRIKGDWAAMLEGMASRSPAPVKIPFVPLRMSGRALRAVLEDLLPAVLGRNPSLLTVIFEDGEAIKAYAEDARPGGPTGGVYEELVRLPIERGAKREDLIELARSAGVEPGVVKEAETAFFERFAEEPEDLLEALALLVCDGAEALRLGLIRFDPPLPAAGLAKLVRIGSTGLTWIMSRLLPEGRCGIGLSCTGGSGGLVLEVRRTEEAGRSSWTVREFEAKTSTVSELARELLDREGCGVALALRLPAVARLTKGEIAPADFLRGRGELWDIETRSGLEGLLAAVPGLVELLGLEGDLEECNISLDSILGLVLDYLRSAGEYAEEKGILVELTDGEESITVLLDGEGVKEGNRQPEGDAREGDDEALELDMSLVRRAISLLSSDPFAGVRELVPLEVVNSVSYTTAVVLVECRRPRGKLLLFGGPHQFFNRAWEGDACAVFVEKSGPVHVSELPSTPLVIEEEGRRLVFAPEAGEVRAELHFERARSRREQHGAGRLVGGTRLAEWLPGLELTRGLHRLTSGRAEIDGRELDIEWGWMYLEEGRGRLLRWPFGATWHYASWLFPSGECGSGVHAAPMLGRSTPAWWRKILETATDGAVLLGADGGGSAAFETALDPGPPVRLVRDAARTGEIELRYRVLSAALVPFDEDGQMIFRLRCLAGPGEGVGLVEIPASLPGTPSEACACGVVFTEDGISLRAGGRELLLVESAGSSFLSPYTPTERGILRRVVRRAGLIFGREG